MSMEYLLLGFLNRGARSGYDLHKEFGDLLEKGWNADRRQIYYLLHKMEKNGWLDVEVIPQDDNPNKKVYHITPSGQEALKEWVRTPMRGETAPFNWMGQLFLAYEVETLDVIQILEHRCAHLEERIEAGTEALEETEQMLAGGETVTPFLMYRIMSLHHGFTYTVSELKWARRAIEMLTAFEDNKLDSEELAAKLLSLLRDMAASAHEE